MQEDERQVITPSHHKEDEETAEKRRRDEFKPPPPVFVLANLGKRKNRQLNSDSALLRFAKFLLK